MGLLSFLFGHRQPPETPFERGYRFAQQSYAQSPTQATYDKLMVLQDDQVNRTEFDRGMRSFLMTIDEYDGGIY